MNTSGRREPTGSEQIQPETPQMSGVPYSSRVDSEDSSHCFVPMDALSLRKNRAPTDSPAGTTWTTPTALDSTATSQDKSSLLSSVDTELNHSHIPSANLLGKLNSLESEWADHKEAADRSVRISRDVSSSLSVATSSLGSLPTNGYHVNQLNKQKKNISVIGTPQRLHTEHRTRRKQSPSASRESVFDRLYYQARRKQEQSKERRNDAMESSVCSAVSSQSSLGATTISSRGTNANRESVFERLYRNDRRRARKHAEADIRVGRNINSRERRLAYIAPMDIRHQRNNTQRSGGSSVVSNSLSVNTTDSTVFERLYRRERRTETLWKDTGSVCSMSSRRLSSSPRNINRRSQIPHLRGTPVDLIPEFSKAQDVSTLSMDDGDGYCQESDNVWSATLIQSAWKAGRARRIFLGKKASAIVIQSAWRMHTGSLVQERETLLTGATIQNIIDGETLLTGATLQNIIDGDNKRQSNTEIAGLKLTASMDALDEDMAASCIVSYWKCWICRQKFLRGRKGVIILQSCTRMTQEKSQFTRKIRMMRELKATRQRAEESEIFQLAVSQNPGSVFTLDTYDMKVVFFDIEIAALQLQSWWRMSISTRNFKLLRGMVLQIQTRYRVDLRMRNRLAVLSLQKWWRVNKRRQSLDSAAIHMKSLCKGRELFAKYKSISDDVTKVQRTSRRTALLRSRCYSALCIQHAFRVHFCRKRCEAATRIQAYSRSFLFRDRFRLMRISSVLIQASIRKNIYRQRFLQRKNACLRIQRINIRVQKDLAAEKLQSLWRGVMVRSQFLVFRAAASLIQAGFRMWLARCSNLAIRHPLVSTQQLYQFRTQLIARSLRDNAMAAKVQSAWRRFVSQRRYCLLRKNVTLMQSHFRRSGPRTYFLTTVSAIRIIQFSYRVHRRTLLGANLCHFSALLVQTKWRRFNCQNKFVDARIAVCVIQSALRGFSARSKFREAKKAALIMQSSYRLHRTCMLTRQTRLVASSAVIIQTSWRAHTCAGHFVALKRAGCVVQAWYRTMTARLAMLQDSSATVVQSVWRGYRCRVALTDLSKAATIIQALSRGYLLRKRVQSRHEEMYAVYLIQNAWRVYVHREEFSHTRAASVILQSFFRGLLARSHCREVLEEKAKNASATLIQAAWRAALGRGMLSDARIGSTLIQTSFRGYLVRLMMARQRENLDALEDQSAIAIQVAWRGSVCRKVLSQIYQVRLEAAASTLVQSLWRGSICRARLRGVRVSAVLVQAIVRGFMLRKRVQSMREELHAVCLIQNAWRDYVHREDFSHTRVASVILQSFFRGLLARSRCRKVLEEKVKNASATLIQAAWRATLGRGMLSDARIGSTLIQTSFRGYLVRLMMARQRENLDALEDQSAIAIQVAWRGSVCRKVLSQIYQVRLEAAASTLVQSLWRGSICRARLGGVRVSAVLVQAIVRGFMLRKRVQSMREELHAVCLIQNAWRVYVHREDFSHVRVASVILQSFFRGLLARSHCRKVLEEKAKNASATLIQAAWRAALGRGMLSDARIGSTLIQTSFRGYLVRLMMARQRENLDALEDQSAIAIQVAWRGSVCRKVLSQIYQVRLEAAASTLVQSLWRGSICRARLGGVRVSAVLVQAIVRGFMLRKRVQSMREELHAVCLIQNAWRVYVHREDFSHVRVASVRLQSFFRGLLARSRYTRLKEYKRRDGSATLIQTVWRLRVVREEFTNCRMAAMMTQTAFRGRFARQRLLQRSSTFIQASWRGYFARSNFLHSQIAASVLQSFTRGIITRAQFLKMKNIARAKEFQDCTIAIQRMWRCHAHRASYRATIEAAGKIQGFIRLRIGQSRRLGYLKAIRSIQAWYRKRCKFAKEAAASRIQRLWKNKLERKQTQSIGSLDRFFYTTVSPESTDTAAKSIQLLWRCHVQNSKLRVMKEATILIQRVIRGWSTRKLNIRTHALISFLNDITRKIQVTYAKWKMVCTLLKLETAVILVHRCMEGSLSRSTTIFALLQISASLTSKSLSLYTRVCASEDRDGAHIKDSWDRAKSTALQYSALIIQKGFRLYLKMRDASNCVDDSFDCAKHLRFSERCKVMKRLGNSRQYPIEKSRRHRVGVKVLEKFDSRRLKVELCPQVYAQRAHAARILQRLGRKIVRRRLRKSAAQLAARMVTEATKAAEKQVFELIQGGRSSSTACFDRLARKVQLSYQTERGCDEMIVSENSYVSLVQHRSILNNERDNKVGISEGLFTSKRDLFISSLSPIKTGEGSFMKS